MKKILITLLIMLLILTGCGTAGPAATEPATEPSTEPATAATEPAHTHTPTQWDCDGKDHWYVCQCGEEVKTPHEIDPTLIHEDQNCPVCNSYIYLDDMGGADVRMFDDQGSMTQNTVYDAQGNVLFSNRYVNTYFDDGNISYVGIYEGDRLIRETFMEHCADPEDGVYVTKDVDYGEDLILAVYSNEAGYVTRVENMDPEGNITRTEEYIMEFDAFGNRIREEVMVEGVLERLITEHYDQEGNYQGYDLYYYNEDGSVREEYHYDGEGNEITQ